jgi:hypothetical protein
MFRTRMGRRPGLMELRSPGKVVRPYIDRDCRQAQTKAEPEQRRMVNSPPVASAGPGFASVVGTIILGHLFDLHYL